MERIVDCIINKRKFENLPGTSFLYLFSFIGKLHVFAIVKQTTNSIKFAHFSVLSPFQRFIPISAFYPHFSVLSLFQRFIPISAFYPHFSFRFQFPFLGFRFSVLSLPRFLAIKQLPAACAICVACGQHACLAEMQ